MKLSVDSENDEKNSQNDQSIKTAFSLLGIAWFLINTGSTETVKCIKYRSGYQEEGKY